MKLRPTTRLSFPLAAAIAALLATPSASALTYYWDTNGAAAFGSITGAWDGVTTFWNTDSTGATGGTFIASPTNADDLFINGGTTGTITLSGAQVASSLTFATNVNATLSGGTSLTIGGTGTRSGIFVNSGDNAANTISSPLILNSASTALNFSNAGTGLLTIGALTGAATSGTQTLTVGASNAGGITLGGIIGNGGGGGNVALTINSSGTGITSLTGANTYTGAVSVNAGVLNIQNNTALGTVAGGTTVASGAALNIQGSITVGAEALTLNGTGINNNGALRSISGNNNYGGLVTLGSSTIISSDTAANTLTLSNAGTITGAGFDLTAGGAGNIAINSNIGTTTGALTKLGAGTLTLTGTNTFTGNTLVRSGTLQATNQVSLYNNGTAAAWSNTNINVERGATLAFNVGGAGQFTAANINTILGLSNSTTNGFNTGSILGIDTTGASLTYSNIIANTNSGANVLGLTKLGTNTLTLDQNNSYTGGTTISSGTLQLGNGSTTGKLSATGGILNNGTLTINRSDAVAQGTDFSAAPIVGTGAFIKLGAGTTTLNAANTFTGTTTVTAGTLALTNALALQNSAYVTTGSNGTTIGLDVTSALTSGNLTLGGLSGAVNLAGAFTAGFTGSVSNLTLNPQGVQSNSYSGAIANGTMSLTKTGTGTQILAGANTYTGDTIVNGGTLTLGSGATGSLSSSSALKIGGGSTFNYARTGTGQTVNGLTINAGNSTINNTSSQTLTLAAIARTGSAFGTVNFGAATLGTINTTFTNVNNIIGPWATTGATTNLKYAVGGGNISALAGTTATAGTLANVTDATGNFEYSAAATTIGNLTANTLRYSGAATTTAIGATNTLTLNGLMNAGSSTLTLSGGPTTGGIIIGSTNELDIAANAQATTISSVIANGGAAGTLVYSGGGILTLSGSNLYTGGTVINAGNITLNTTASLGSGPVTINTGGTLQLGASVQPNRNFTLNGGTLLLNSGGSSNIVAGSITLAADSIIYGNGSNFSTETISAAISGAGGLTLNGPGRAAAVLLTNASNTYTGPTVINNGALIVKSSLYGNDTSKWTPANITVASNAVLGISVGGVGEFTMAQAATMFTNLTTNVNNNGMRPNSFMSLDTRNAPAGNYIYSAALTDSTGPGGGAVNFEFYGLGATNQLELTGANTYSGVTILNNNGTLRVSSLNSVFTNPTLGTVHSASSSLGAPTTPFNGTIWLAATGWNGNQFPGNTITSGSLIYNGTGETTDRVLQMSSTANVSFALDQSGTGLLKFVSNPNIGVQQHLILAGSTTGTGEIAGAIIQPATGTAATNVTKNGTGTWTLSGANTYTGATTINGGTLMIKGANNLLGTVTVNAGGNFSLADGTARATTGATTGTGLTLATGSTMAFDWNGGSLDSFTTTGTATSSGNVGIIINNTSPTGSGGTLITAASGSTLSTASYFLANNTNFTAALTKTATTVSIGAQTAATALTDAYWKRNQVTGALDTMAYSLGTLSNWASTAAGASANGVVPGGSAVNLIFGTTGSVPGSPTLGADMNLGSITFNDTTAVTLAGSANAITLNSTSGTAATTTAALATVTAGSAISVTSFANASNAISAKLVLGANQTWNVASGKTLAVSGVVSGNKNLTIAATGSTVTLSGANIYNGATTVTGGTLKAGVAGSGVSGAFGYNSAITLANTAGVTMDITGFNTQIGSLTGGGATGGNVTLGAATLTVGGDHTSPGAYAGIISGTGGGLTKIGAGTLTLSGSNTYTGKTTIGAGTLAINSIANGGSPSSIGQSSALPVNLALSGVTLLYAPISGVGAAGHSTDRNFSLAANNTIDASGTGALIFNAPTGNIISPDVTGLTGSWLNNGYNAIITGLSSTANLAVGMSVSGTGLGQLSNTKIVSIDSASQVTLDRPANAAGSTLAVGFGFDTRTLTLTGTNTNANTIAGNLQDSSAAGAGILGLNKSGVGTWALSGSNTYTGTTIISGGSLQIGAGGTTGSLTGTASITNDANLTINRSDAFTQAAGLNNKVISGTGSFTQAGGGTTTLSLTNTYTGATNVTGGTLQLDGSTHASSTVGIATAGTLTGIGTVNGNATLTGNGTINKASGTLAGTLGVTGGNWNGAGAVTGLVTSSSGTFTIGSGANLTANGNLNVTGGTIAAGDATSTITGSVNYTSSSNSTFVGVIAGADKTLTMNNAAASLILSGANTYTGITTISSGTMQLGSGSTTGSISTSSAIVNNANFTINRSNAVVQGADFSAAAITGSGSFTQAGAGTTTLNAANTYTGATNVTGGKLLINGSTTTSSAVTVANGATLGGSGALGGSVTVQTGGTFAPGNSIESIATGNLALLASAVFAQEIDKSVVPGISGDLTATTGSLSITSGAIFSLNELGLSGAWASGNKITLIGYSTGTWNGGLFTYLGNTLNDDSNFTFSGSDWAFNYNDATFGDNYQSDLSGFTDSARYVTMTVIPETNVAALIGGFGVLALLRRRR